MTVEEQAAADKLVADAAAAEKKEADEKGEKGADEKNSKGADNMIPKTRFDEINNKYKEMKTQLDNILTLKETEDRENEAKKLDDKKKAGDFENLYNQSNTDLEKYKGESKTGKDRVESLEGIITVMLDAKLETIPEEYRGLIPELAPEAKLAWLTNAESKGLFGVKEDNSEKAIGGSTNPSGNQSADTSKLTPMELLKAAYSSIKK